MSISLPCADFLDPLLGRMLRHALPVLGRWRRPKAKRRSAPAFPDLLHPAAAATLDREHLVCKCVSRSQVSSAKKKKKKQLPASAQLAGGFIRVVPSPQLALIRHGGAWGCRDWWWAGRGGVRRRRRRRRSGVGWVSISREGEGGKPNQKLATQRSVSSAMFMFFH